MAGTVKVELQGQTKEEIKKQFEDIIKHLDQVQIDKNKGTQDLTANKPALWKISYET
ncbi:MAG: hypothetical protein NVSMB26_21400 [Beijerinckiaceae bacterium]